MCNWLLKQFRSKTLGIKIITEKIASFVRLIHRKSILIPRWIKYRYYISNISIEPLWADFKHLAWICINFWIWCNYLSYTITNICFVKRLKMIKILNRLKDMTRNCDKPFASKKSSFFLISSWNFYLSI